jgi:hypothetical protein
MFQCIISALFLCFIDSALGCELPYHNCPINSELGTTCVTFTGLPHGAGVCLPPQFN